MAERLAHIAVTPGEPAGIGPDITLLAAQHALPCALTAIADPDLLRQRAELLGLNMDIVESDGSADLHRPGRLRVLPVPLAKTARCGELDPANAEYVLQSLRLAGEGCLHERFDAMATAPVHKGVINQSGVPFSGHTEFLAELTEAPLPVMMLATENLRVALATTHLPLRAVADAITTERLEQVCRILVNDLRIHFGIQEPRVLVCGLNPHAGEDGHLGREEIDVITPVLEQLRREGLQLIGPLPADTLFTPRHLEQADAVLAMYHDQGLPVLKYEGFGNAINVTLGLPIIRTSVDHGTALELAGTGKASANSLLLAINTAVTMARAARR